MTTLAVLSPMIKASMADAVGFLRVNPLATMTGLYLDGFSLGVQLALIDPDVARTIFDHMALIDPAHNLAHDVAEDVEQIRKASR